MKKLLILMTVVSSLTLTACASEKSVLNELTNDAYQGVNEFEQVTLNLNENPEIVNDFIPSNVLEDRNEPKNFNAAIGRYSNVVEERRMPEAYEKHPSSPEELFNETMNSGKETENRSPKSEEEKLIDKLFHPTNEDEVKDEDVNFDETLNDLIDKIIVRAPHGSEPNVWISIDDKPFVGGEIEMERCIDGMLHITCYAGDQECYSNFIDVRMIIRDRLERSGEMMVRVDVEYGKPDRYVPGTNDRRPRF